METYESGAHMCHTTLPTDALQRLQETMLETEAYGFDKVREERADCMSKLGKLRYIESCRFRQPLSRLWQRKMKDKVIRSQARDIPKGIEIIERVIEIVRQKYSLNLALAKHFVFPSWLTHFGCR